MSINWVRYKTGETTTEIYNLDQAHYFRHVSAGDESVVEFEIQGEKFRVMYSVDAIAYREAMDYIKGVTGHDL
jgi:mRNA-degrading endonuclease HigB of HigAB toxin-antitoxin module